MFLRRKSEHEKDSTMSDGPDGLASSIKPLPGSGPRPLVGATTTGAKPATLPPGVVTPPMPLSTPRPMDATARRPEGHGPPIIPTPKARDTEMRRLIVGREISLTGEITSCDRLIVEGNVEANLTNCREVEIAETGLLKGTAAIDDAEIRGRYEGTLAVRKRLLIRATGKVVGTVRYGLLEIECGGQISGDIQAQPSNEEPETRPRPIVTMPSEMKL
jgi:cytoskeletal protein CcmA (bactofilin family)